MADQTRIVIVDDHPFVREGLKQLLAGQNEFQLTGEASSIADARIVLGAVAPIPWRSNRAEAALLGKPLNEATLLEVARAAIVGATPLSDNGYKVGLVQTLVRRTLAQLA